MGDYLRSPRKMRIGLHLVGSGCAPEGLPAEKRELKIMPDDFRHEQATRSNVKSKDLAVLTSCERRSVVNSARSTIKVSGVTKVHAILGGFHLMPMPQH